MTDHKEQHREKSGQKRNSRISSYAKFSGVAFQMMAIIGLGTYGGVKLDEAYPNKHSIYTILLSLASVVMAMYYVMKQVSDNSSKKNKK